MQPTLTSNTKPSEQKHELWLASHYFCACEEERNRLNWLIDQRDRLGDN